METHLALKFSSWKQRSYTEHWLEASTILFFQTEVWDLCARTFHVCIVLRSGADLLNLQVASSSLFYSNFYKKNIYDMRKLKYL